jgi:hypothetical protein
MNTDPAPARPPYDPERLERLILTADKASAIHQFVANQCNDVVAEIGRVQVAIGAQEMRSGERKPGSAHPDSYTRLEYLKERRRSLDAELSAATTVSAPLRQLRDACVKFARRHGHREHGASGAPSLVEEG